MMSLPQLRLQYRKQTLSPAKPHAVEQEMERFFSERSQTSNFVLHDWGSALVCYARRHETNVKAVMEFIHPMTWDEWQKPAKACFKHSNS